MLTGPLFHHTTNHDKNAEGASLLLLLHPTEQVIADDVDQTRAQIVFGLHNHIDAVWTEGGEPASEGLQAQRLTPITALFFPLTTENISFLEIVINIKNTFVSHFWVEH